MARPLPTASSRTSPTETALIAGRHVEVVDLTLPLDEGLPCTWPGHTAFVHRIDADFASGASYRTATLVMDEHTGTHVDAPCHSIPTQSLEPRTSKPVSERTTATIPLADMIGPAVVIDATALTETGDPGRSPMLGADAAMEVERSSGLLRPGDIVLLRTGWDTRYLPFPHGDAYTAKQLAGEERGWPAPDESFIDLLVDRGVCCVGTDAPSIGALHDPGPAHVLALGNGIWPVEGLRGLGTLPPRGATFVFLPLAIGGSGAPGRAIGLIPAHRGP